MANRLSPSKDVYNLDCEPVDSAKNSSKRIRKGSSSRRPKRSHGSKKGKLTVFQKKKSLKNNSSQARLASKQAKQDSKVSKLWRNDLLKVDEIKSAKDKKQSALSHLIHRSDSQSKAYTNKENIR